MPLASQLARSVPVAVLLAALAGCASVSVATDPLKLPAGANQSPVVVSITANTGEVQGFTDMSVHLVPPKGRENETPQYFVLQRKAPDMARDTSLFVGALPPGEYEINALRDATNNKILRLDNGSKKLDSFVVEAGKPVDLGRMIVTPINNHILFGRSERVGSNTLLLERASPQHAALFARAPASGWGHPRLPADRAEEYAASRPLGANCPTELPDGAVVAASRLGVVLRRAPDGRWSALRGPGIDSLLCVTAADLPDAELLAVGEFSTLLRKPPQEDKLLPVATGNLPAGNIVGITGSRKAGWTVGVHSGSTVTVLHTPELHSGNWKPAASLDVGFSFWTGAHHFWMWGDAQRMGYTVTTGPIHELDYASGKWTMLDTPNKAQLREVAFEPSGAVGVLTSAAGGAGGIFAGVFVSNDRARSWKPVEVPYNVKVAPIRHDYAGTMYMAGGALSEPELQVSKDGGKTWTHAAKRSLGRQLLPLRSGELLDFGGAEHGIFSIGHSTDGGRTWEVEYSNFDRRAYEMSRK
ncbi:MAG: hypothetical protein AB1807_01550 [Pseudomonadota bacterium]